METTATTQRMTKTTTQQKPQSPHVGVWEAATQRARQPQVPLQAMGGPPLMALFLPLPLRCHELVVQAAHLRRP